MLKKNENSRNEKFAKFSEKKLSAHSFSNKLSDLILLETIKLFSLGSMSRLVL